MYGVDRRDIDSCGFSWSEQADADLLRPFPVQLLPGVLVLEAVNGLVHQELDVGTALLQGLIDGMGFIGCFLNGELIGLAGEFRVEPVRDLELLKDINGSLVHSLHSEVADAVVFLFLESGFFLQFPAGSVRSIGVGLLFYSLYQSSSSFCTLTAGRFMYLRNESILPNELSRELMKAQA